MNGETSGAAAHGGGGATAPLGAIAQQRVVEKLDEYMSRRDYAAAERHLLYWLEEARTLRDKRGELMVRNELVGHFRKVGNRQRAFEHAEAALLLIDELGFGNTISAGTTYTNAATAFNAFGENERALALFEKAAALYEGSPRTDPRLLGGVRNNRALVCVALRRFDEADALYQRALEAMAQVENGELEQAITYLNMADAAVARARADAQKAAGGERDTGQGALEEAGDPAVAPAPATAADADLDAFALAACEDEVERLLDKALALLDTPTVPRDGYYAFVCEKCAPTFAYYGYFLADADLRERARTIYERP